MCGENTKSDILQIRAKISHNKTGLKMSTGRDAMLYICLTVRQLLGIVTIFGPCSGKGGLNPSRDVLYPEQDIT